MNVKITTFTDPFSFFCVINDECVKDVTPPFNNNVDYGNRTTKKSFSDVDHGQYVAVMWKNKWTRGVITMETKFLIWLIDYGVFLHPDDKSVYTDLPPEYKKLPTRVFEASIHGVNPIDKVINEDFQIVNTLSTSWTNATVDKCQKLLESASKAYFVPIAFLCTKYNDIVLGDLYLELSGRRIVNLVDELELWPTLLERNKDVYIKNLSIYYTTRRKHRACVLKPNFPETVLPELTFPVTLEEYTAVTKKVPEMALKLQPVDPYESDNDFETEVEYKRNKDSYNLTPSEVEKYSELYVTIHGEEHNVLNILVNKARDLRMCERYKDHDLKSVGRGITTRWSHGN